MLSTNVCQIQILLNISCNNVWSLSLNILINVRRFWSILTHKILVQLIKQAIYLHKLPTTHFNYTTKNG